VAVPAQPRRQLQLSAQIQSGSWRIGRQVAFRASVVLASRSAEPPSLDTWPSRTAEASHARSFPAPDYHNRFRSP
jgi:hypothetical protein